MAIKVSSQPLNVEQGGGQVVSAETYGSLKEAFRAWVAERNATTRKRGSRAARASLIPSGESIVRVIRWQVDGLSYLNLAEREIGATMADMEAASKALDEPTRRSANRKLEAISAAAGRIRKDNRKLIARIGLTPRSLAE